MNWKLIFLLFEGITNTVAIPIASIWKPPATFCYSISTSPAMHGKRR